MKKDKIKPEQTPPPLAYLKDVLALLETPVETRFYLDGREVVLKVNRALKDVVEKRRAILRAPQPPFVKERNDYDSLNPQYLAQRDAAVSQARCFTAYYCCPELAALKPGLMDPAQIHAAIGALIPENILGLIELTALKGGLDVDVARQANFSSDAPLES